jgi:low affinity Fe/Cu permease
LWAGLALAATADPATPVAKVSTMTVRDPLSDLDMPSSVTGNLKPFDRFATAVSRFASHATFFAGCVLLVIVWAPSYFIFRDVNTWQLVINTATTIVTFLLVALLQNSQSRADAATNHKLNAIAEALSELMTKQDDPELEQAIVELRDAVGLEHREHS